MPDQMKFPFNLEPYRKVLGPKYDHASQLLDRLFGLVRNLAENLLEAGQVLCTMEDEHGPNLVKTWCDTWRFLSYRRARVLMRLWRRLHELDLDGTAAGTVVEVFAQSEGLRESEVEPVFEWATDGDTAADIQAKLAALRDRPIAPPSEAEVRHAMLDVLEKKGEAARAEITLPNGTRVDILTDEAVYECKRHLTRPIFYRALGQTEAASWDVPGRTRVICAETMDPEIQQLRVQAESNGIHVVMVTLPLRLVSHG